MCEIVRRSRSEISAKLSTFFRTTHTDQQKSFFQKMAGQRDKMTVSSSTAAAYLSQNSLGQAWDKLGQMWDEQLKKMLVFRRSVRL
jgi:hypothetical protein